MQMAVQKQTWDPGVVDLDEPTCFCASLSSPESWFPAGCEKRRYSFRISIKEALGWEVQSGWEGGKLWKVAELSCEPHTFN